MVRRILYSVLALAIISDPVSYADNVAQYPPSIEAPKAGQPIQAPVPPSKPDLKPVVPVATSTSIPTPAPNPVPVSTKTFTSSTPINTTTLAARPVAVTTDLLLGGIANSKLSSTPVAAVKPGSKSEVQLAEDVPTRISLSGLARNATATIVVVTSNGKRISLGTLKVSSTGSLTLPPLTIQNEGKSATVQVTVSGKTTSIVVRATS